jgi:hypothetical protein
LFNDDFAIIHAVMEGKRFVAFADILGFRELLRVHSLQDIAKRVSLLLDGVAGLNVRFVEAGGGFRPGVFRPHAANFSDSIVLWSDVLDDFMEMSSFANGLMFARCLAELVGGAFVSDLPLRVGVAFGDTYVDEVRNIVIGQPLVNAYELEQAQEWVGGAFDSSVPLEVVEHEGGAVRYAVPLKADFEGQCHAAIDWTPSVGSLDTASTEQAIANFNSALSLYLRNAQTESVRKKYLNAKRFVEDCIRAKRARV